jgi:peroxiredoxin
VTSRFSILVAGILLIGIGGGCDKKPTDPDGPVAPTLLEATAETVTSITLTWQDNSDDEDGFRIERSTEASTGFEEIATVGTDVITHTETGLDNQTMYYFRVCAYNNDGDSYYSNVAGSTPTTYGSDVGSIMADFTALDQSGQSVSLSDFAGNVVLLDFSADWCGPCRVEATHLESFFNEFKDRGFQVITLMIDGSPADWAQEYGLSFPVLDDDDRAVYDIYGIGYVPLNIVIDQDFIIRYKDSGYDETTIRAVLGQLLPPS